MTPVVIDAFTRVMLKYFDARTFQGLAVGFQSLFGQPGTGALTVFSNNALVADIDIISGNTKTARMVPRGLVGVSTGPESKRAVSETFKSYSRAYPLIEEVIPYTASDLNMRAAGEAPHAPVEKVARLRMRAQRDSLELVRRTVRAFEILAAQSIVTGSHDAIIGTTDPNMVYSFGRDGDLTMAAAGAWNDNNNDPIADLEELCTRIKQRGGVVPDMAIMGASAAAAFANNTQVQSKADTRRFNLVSIDSEVALPPQFKRFTDAGLVLFGKVITPSGYKLYCFTYMNNYTNENGDFVPYMPVDKCVVMYSQARLDRLFGPDEVLPATAAKVAMIRELFGLDPMIELPPSANPNITDILAPEMFHLDAFYFAEDKGVGLRLQAAPIFPTTFANAIGCITDTIGN